jgi:hypothetical protein
MARRPDPAAIATAKREGAICGLCARLRLSRPTVEALVARWAVEAVQRDLDAGDYRYWTACESWIKGGSGAWSDVEITYGATS